MAYHDQRVDENSKLRPPVIEIIESENTETYTGLCLSHVVMKKCT